MQPVARLDRQGDGNGEQVAAGQAHLRQHALEVGLAHEAVQRREGAHRQQLQVAHHPLRDLQRRQPARVRFQVVGGCGRHQQVYQFATIRADQVVRLRGVQCKLPISKGSHALAPGGGIRRQA